MSKDYDHAGELRKWVKEYTDSLPEDERKAHDEKREREKSEDEAADARIKSSEEAARQSDREVREGGGFCPNCNMIRTHCTCHRPT